jgi:hypothetical protein
MLFVETLAEDVRGQGIEVNSRAPGALNTAMLDEVIAAGPAAVGEAFYARALKQKASGGARLDLGATLALFLASAASAGIIGKLISAVCDNWETLLARRELAEGRLVASFLHSTANIIYVGHFFVYLAYRYGETMISRFLTWLLQELAEAAPDAATVGKA